MKWWKCVPVKSWRRFLKAKFELLPVHVKVASELKAYMSGEEWAANLNLATRFGSVKEGERVIWQFWDKGEENAPPIVRRCLQSVCEFGGYRQVVLNDENFCEFVNLPECIVEKYKNGTISKAHFSDILRVALLCIYGGVWLDATVFLSAHPCEFEREFFVPQRSSVRPKDYMRWVKFSEGYFSWEREFGVKMSSSVMVCDVKSGEIFRESFNVLARYWAAESSLKHYFLFQIAFNELLKKECFGAFVLSEGDTEMHELQFVAKGKFDAALWEAIRQKSSFHKLTYFKNLKNGSFVSVVLGL